MSSKDVKRVSERLRYVARNTEEEVQKILREFDEE